MSREGDKELKVRLPLPQHIRLHTIKVLDGQPIQDTVRLALEAYFVAYDAHQQRLPSDASAQPKAHDDSKSSLTAP